MKLKELLRLDLQTFADKGGEGGTDNTNDDVDTNTPGSDVEQGAGSPDGAENTGEQGADDKKIPYDRFKQKVDEVNALKEELAKIKEAEEAKRREDLEEQEKYKELYEELVRKSQEQEKERLEKSKQEALKSAGYDDTQVELMLKLVTGESEEDIKDSIETLKKTFPVNQGKPYVDPSADNGGRSKPKAKDGEEYGKDMFKKLFDKGKLKGFKK